MVKSPFQEIIRIISYIFPGNIFQFSENLIFWLELVNQPIKSGTKILKCPRHKNSQVKSWLWEYGTSDDANNTGYSNGSEDVIAVEILKFELLINILLFRYYKYNFVIFKNIISLIMTTKFRHCFKKMKNRQWETIGYGLLSELMKFVFVFHKSLSFY